MLAFPAVVVAKPVPPPEPGRIVAALAEKPAARKLNIPIQITNPVPILFLI